MTGDGRVQAETIGAVTRVSAFLDTWLGHSSTSAQIASIYSGAKGEGDRFVLLVRDLRLVLDHAPCTCASGLTVAECHDGPDVREVRP